MKYSSLITSLVFIYSVSALGAESLVERFVDDTEVYDYVNDDRAKEKVESNIVFVMDNSTSMETLPSLRGYGSEVAGIESKYLKDTTWNPDNYYQVINDPCKTCDHNAGKNYISTVKNLKMIKKIQMRHLTGMYFSNCGPNNSACVASENSNVFSALAWPLTYPYLLLDGYIDLSSVNGICNVKVKIHRDTNYHTTKEFLFDTKIEYKVSVPVNSNADCNSAVLDKDKVLKSLVFKYKHNLLNPVSFYYKQKNEYVTDISLASGSYSFKALPDVCKIEEAKINEISSMVNFDLSDRLAVKPSYKNNFLQQYTDDEQLCALRKMKDISDSEIATFNYRNYLTEINRAKEDGSYAYHWGSRFDITVASLEYALKNAVKNTVVRILPFKHKTNTKEGVYSYNSVFHRSLEAVANFNQGISHSYYFGENEVENKKFADEIASELKFHGTSGGTPSLSSLWMASYLSRLDLKPSVQCQVVNKILMFTDGRANSATNDLMSDFQGIFKKTSYLSDIEKTDLISKCSFTLGLQHNIEADRKIMQKETNSCLVGVGKYLGTNTHPKINSITKDGIDFDDSLQARIHVIPIGFSSGLDKTAKNTLNEISKASRGEDALFADDFEKLKKAFVDGLEAEVLTSDMTVSPSTPPSAGGGISSGMASYFGLFKPTSSPYWDGNVKCYELNISDSSKSYKDKQNAVAICKDKKDPAGCTQSGQINPASVDFFNSSNDADGAEVTDGGVLNRKVELTDADNTNPITPPRAHFDKTAIEQESITPESVEATTDNELMLAIKSSWNRVKSRSSLGTEELSEQQIKEALSWLSGYQMDSAGVETPRMDWMGDFLHAGTAVLNYPGKKSLLFVGSNDGYFRAFKIGPGEALSAESKRFDYGSEMYSFIPKELFDVVWSKLNYVASEGFRAKHYGMDGSIRTLHLDTNLDGIVNDGEQAYAIVGMRRGGNSYYLFDVSKYPSIRPEPVSSSAPGATQPSNRRPAEQSSGIRFIRRISGVETFLNKPLVKREEDKLKRRPELTNRDGLDIKKFNKERKAYRWLAQTWSKPNIIKFKWKNYSMRQGEVTPPAGCDRGYCYAWVFGGGYNPSVRDQRRTRADYEKDNPNKTPYRSSVYNLNKQDDYIGNAIYIVNAATGDLLWWAAPDSDADVKIKKLESVPGGVNVINVGSDNGNATDAGFFLDIEGNLYRLNFYDFIADIEVKDEKDSTKVGPWKGLIKPQANRAYVKLGSVIPKDKKGFTYYQPAVTFLKDPDGYDYFAIGFGTGYRAHPKDKTQDSNILGVVFDYPVYNPVYSSSEKRIALEGIDGACSGSTVSCLMDVTELGAPSEDNGNDPYADLKRFRVRYGRETENQNKFHGWFVRLKGNGEKVITSGLTVNGKFAIESFKPKDDSESNAKQCVADLGEKRIYMRYLATGIGAFSNNNSFKVSGTSLPAEHLGLIKHKGKLYLTARDVSEKVTHDVVDAGSATNPKRAVGWRERVLQEKVFSEPPSNSQK